MDGDMINLNWLSDTETAAHMRKLHYEKFKSLVRMHLSFELDLNTDEFDLACHEIVYEDKGKLKKWNRLSKKHRHAAATGCASSTSKGSISADNSPFETLHQQINAGFLLHLEELKAFLMQDKNLSQEGLFRKTGSASRQNELRQQIQNDRPLDLEGGGYSAHDCATVFKGYLAELPEPLLTDAHYPAHQQIAPLCLGSGSCSSSSTGTLTRPPNPERIKREQHLLSSVQLLLLLLPDENRQLLQHIIDILHAVAAHESENKMTPENLATIFAPHLICPRNLPPEALHYISKTMSSIIAYMICKGQEIFEMPAKLSTDIRAYFMERKRKKTMSPEQTLDESISDMSTVNTVYTFVDREKTAAAHTANNTDTELAQLYAHIQSLPESSKKRRLIKQFNKQNGQGTPLQLVVMNRLKGTDASRSAKSIGDSIKKHIFHKSIMSRTPKRATATAAAATPTAGVETPNFSHTLKNPKLRVLFRSPATATTTQVDSSHSAANTPNKSTAHTPNIQTMHVTANRMHTNTSSTTTTTTTTMTSSRSTTPFTSKRKSLHQHPLHKSISSSSLLSQSSQMQQRKLALHHQTNTNKNAQVSETSTSSLSSHSCSSSSNDGLLPTTLAPKYACSVSAPVTRQNSEDSNVAMLLNPLPANTNELARDSLDGNCCTPLKLFPKTGANKQCVAVAGGANDNRKTVAWNEKHLLAVEEFSNPCTPLQQTPAEFKSRFKSEPNLNRVSSVSASGVTTDGISVAAPEIAASKQHTSSTRSLTRKLMKGVSMSNLRFAFATPESTMRLMVRNVSSTLRRRSAGDDELPKVDVNAQLASAQIYKSAENFDGVEAVSLEDLDDDTFEDNPNDQLDSDCCVSEVEGEVEDSEAEEAQLGVESNYLRAYQRATYDTATIGGALHRRSSSSNSNSSDNSSVSRYRQQLLLQQSNVYRNMELMTSTPSMLLGRRSMSPITKSTQRMPKAMQESIMTPRSRKPVMVLTTTAHSTSDQNQTMCQTDFPDFREQDEDDDEDVHAKDDNADDNDHETADICIGGGLAPHLQCEDATTLDSYATLLRTHQTSLTAALELNETRSVEKVDALSSNFKEYLRSRSVLTATSPVDSSFSSQPDDFGTPKNMEDLNDSQMSPSLLYCLDGHEPDEENAINIDESPSKNQLLNVREDDDGLQAATAIDSNCIDMTATDDDSKFFTPHNAYRSRLFAMNNARKRAATNIDFDNKCTLQAPLTDNVADAALCCDNAVKEGHNHSSNRSATIANKENVENVECYMRSRKLLISEYPGETSF